MIYPAETIVHNVRRSLRLRLTLSSGRRYPSDDIVNLEWSAMSRIESAAVTRRALLCSAAELIDNGGPDAVTLREVGARAGVSRGAPYRHFADKERLLTAVAAQSWERIADDMHALQADSRLSAADQLRAALTVLITVNREQPYLYRLMCGNAVATSSWRSSPQCSGNGTPSATARSC
jgi:DNA-binding transcriptional regulator YbjK